MSTERKTPQALDGAGGEDNRNSEGTASASSLAAVPLQIKSLSRSGVSSPGGDFGDPAIHYPVDALGAYLAPVAEAIQNVVQAPMAICCQSVLAAATLAVQGHANVMHPNGHPRPLCNYYLTLAYSGERKTTCDCEALKPVRNHEKKLEEIRQSEMLAYRDQKESYEQSRKIALGQKFRDKRKEELSRLGLEPEPPLESLITCPEPTFEGLCRLLSEGQPSIGVFSSEGGQFFGGHGMSDENRLRSITGYSNIWDGRSIRVVRKGDGIKVLHGRRVSIHLMMQPEVARPFLANDMLREQGFFSRFLVCAPSSSMGGRFFQEPQEDYVENLLRYQRHMEQIFTTALPLAEGTRNELAPRTLRLCPKAKAAWISYHDECEAKLAPNQEFSEIRGFANKLPEHALRLAGVLALVEDITTSTITLENMERGITLARYYAAEALRIANVRLADSLILAAGNTAVWLRDNWTGRYISVPDLQKNGPRNVRKNAKHTRQVIDILVSNGCLRAAPPTIIDSHRREEVWEVIRD